MDNYGYYSPCRCLQSKLDGKIIMPQCGHAYSDDPEAGINACMAHEMLGRTDQERATLENFCLCRRVARAALEALDNAKGALNRAMDEADKQERLKHVASVEDVSFTISFEKGTWQITRNAEAYLDGEKVTEEYQIPPMIRAWIANEKKQWAEAEEINRKLALLEKDGEME